jgi:hypothetical protein
MRFSQLWANTSAALLLMFGCVVPDRHQQRFQGGNVEQIIEILDKRGLRSTSEEAPDINDGVVNVQSIKVRTKGHGTPIIRNNMAFYLAAYEGADLVVQSVPTGTRMINVIHGIDAPTDYEHNFTGLSLREQKDGSVLVESGEFILGFIAAPSAATDNGVGVPTSFAVDGDTLVQTVKHQETQHPVVTTLEYQACMTRTGAGVCVKLDRTRVARLHGIISDHDFQVTAAGAAAMANHLCSKAPGPVKLGCVVGVATSAMDLFASVNQAYREQRCLLWKIVTLTPGLTNIPHNFKVVDC